MYPAMSRPSGPYRACGPSCSCSSPPGIASHSRSGTPWCCKCWRSLSPSAWPCSPPTAEAGTSAERDGSNSAEPLRAFRLWNILARVPLMQPFDLVLSACMVINVLLSLRSHCTFIKRGTKNESRSCSMVNTRARRSLLWELLSYASPLPILPLRFHCAAHSSCRNRIVSAVMLQITPNSFAAGQIVADVFLLFWSTAVHRWSQLAYLPN